MGRRKEDNYTKIPVEFQHFNLIFVTIKNIIYALYACENVDNDVWCQVKVLWVGHDRVGCSTCIIGSVLINPFFIWHWMTCCLTITNLKH